MRDKKRFLTVLLSIMCMLSLILTSFSITAVSSADDISGDDGTVEGTDDEDEEDEGEDEGEEDFPEYEYGEYSKMTLTTLKKDGSGVKKAVSNTYEKKATGVKTSKLRFLKSTKKGTVELSWKKNAKATGYEIYMSNKKSSGYKKVATIKNNNTVKYIKKKLKSGEKFFFKIRAYVVKKKVKTFTKYSAVKSITVK